MTRFLRAVILPLVLLSLCTVDAHAYRLVEKVLSKRAYQISSNTTDPGFKPTTGTAGYVDSTYWSWNVAGASTASIKDTTATFTLDNWALIPTQPGNTVSAVDSLYGFELVVYPFVNQTGAAAFDTCTALLQGSNDGSVWTAGTPIGAGNYMLEIGTSNSACKTFNFIWSIPTPATPINSSMGHFKSYRVILGGGGAYGGTDSGQFQASIRYWQDAIPPNLR